ncbi:hypothetical protein SAMN04487950_4333 [Halogranum rubrum]|uniref:Uncharacterized protein n=2 Tax=Halogranum rubrum TaxID=553466 RepID=A0A1I4J242_9EURY|nr:MULTISPECIES: hypothetical protein [Halogranum]SFL60307.1 hypothetical protein SAMN04487950_4333 [Halogranum rubrum]
MSNTSDSEVMCSVDEDGSTERLVVADLARDDAWLSMRLDDVSRVVPQQR